MTSRAAKRSRGPTSGLGKCYMIHANRQLPQSSKYPVGFFHTAAEAEDYLYAVLFPDIDPAKVVRSERTKKSVSRESNGLSLTAQTKDLIQDRVTEEVTYQIRAYAYGGAGDVREEMPFERVFVDSRQRFPGPGARQFTVDHSAF